MRTGIETPPAYGRSAVIFIVLVCVNSLLAIAGWLFNLPVLASLHPGYIPMAPAAALIFLGLCGAWFLHRYLPDRRWIKSLVWVGLAGMLIIVILFIFRYFTGLGPDLEKPLYSNLNLSGQFSSGRLSPFTLLGFLLAIPAFLSLTWDGPGKPIRIVSNTLSLVLLVLSGLVILGYLYGVLPFYAGVLIPVALSSAISFCFLSLGLLMTAGPDSWPTSLFTGTSLKARLMRTIIPASILVILIQGYLNEVPSSYVTIHPTLRALIVMLVALLIFIPIISFIAKNLNADIEAGRQAQTLQQAVYRIAAATETTRSLDELFHQIHQIIASVMPAENFYISLYDEAQNLLRFSYFKDAEDEPFIGGIQPGKGLTAYVLRTGKSLLCTQAVHDELERRGEVKLLGVPSAIWLGVPLVLDGKTTGAMVVQHYTDPRAYGEREQHMLEFVSTQVAIAINRKRAEEALRENEEKFRDLFDNAEVGMFRTRLDGSEILDMNEKFLEIFGRPRAEMQSSPSRLYWADPREREEMVRRANAEGRVVDFECGMLDRQGQVKRCLLSFRLNQTQELLEGSIIDITERKQAQTLQEAVYRIAAATETTPSLDELYHQIHQIISSVMPAENFYISLYDEVQNLLRFSFFKDPEDELYVKGIQPGKGLTAYVLRTGKSLLCTQAVHDELERRGEVILLGVPSAIWLGVPLIVEGKTIGAMVVQHYSDPNAYGEREQHMLEFVSTQVAIAITRKRAEDALRQSEAELRALFASMHDVVMVVDRFGVYLKIAPTNPELLVRPPGELLGKNLREIFQPHQAEIFLDTIKKVLDSKQSDQIEYDLQIGNRTVWFSVTISLMTEDSTLWVAHDITERKRFELVQNALYRITQTAITSEGIEALYRSIHHILGELIPADNFFIALIDPVSGLISFPYYIDQYDEPPVEPTPQQGLTGYIIRTGCPLLASRQVFDRLVQQGDVEPIGTFGVDWMGAPLKVGERLIGVMAVQIYTEGSHYEQEDLNILEFVSTQVANAIERKRMEEEIRNLSLTDALTGLYNRRGFTLLAEQEVKLAHRINRTMLLFFCDVDNLKGINDCHGHTQGDLALKEVSAILKETFREADILGRLGGDEFVVLAVDASLENADIMTNRIHTALEKRNRQGDRPYQLNLSMGVARCDPQAACLVGDLIDEADTRMYNQKQARKANP